jgi:hypothetical protein
MAVIIEHPDAYDRATRRAILSNARKTFERTYPDHEAILTFISAGRIDGGRVCTYQDNFVGSLAKAFDTYGKLTEGQVNAVRRCIAQRDERRAEWADKQAALNASRQHLGVVGEKITLTLTIRHIAILDGYYGTNYIYVMEDAEQNVVIYKGTSEVIGYTPERSLRGRGDVLTFTATVKEHGVRDGVKQTIIQRPKAA